MKGKILLLGCVLLLGCCAMGYAQQSHYRDLGSSSARAGESLSGALEREALQAQKEALKAQKVQLDPIEKKYRKQIISRIKAEHPNYNAITNLDTTVHLYADAIVSRHIIEVVEDSEKYYYFADQFNYFNSSILKRLQGKDRGMNLRPIKSADVEAVLNSIKSDQEEK